jgi:hypothetical protein
MGRFPPPPPFVVVTDVEETEWIVWGLSALQHRPPLVGHIVPSGYEAYARVLHPARRFLAPSIEASVVLRWSEIAAARGKVMHPQVGIDALIDNPDPFDYEHWKAISAGEGEWSPPYEWLEATDGLALLSLLRPYTSTDNGWASDPAEW